jgi:hypothetical protein
VRTGTQKVEPGARLWRVLAPSQDTFVDPEHHGGVRHNPHQVCAESTVQRSCTLLSDHETEGLNESGIFFDTIYHRLPKSRPEDLTGEVIVNTSIRKIRPSVPREDMLSN